MASNWPTGFDNLSINKVANSDMADHPFTHNDLADAINKNQTEMGLNPSGSYSTTADRFTALETPIYRNLFRVSSRLSTGANIGAISLLSGPTGGPSPPSVGDTAAVEGGWLDSSELLIAGKTTKIRTRVTEFHNSVAPSGTLTFNLHPVTAIAGPTTAVTYTLGTAICPVVITPGTSLHQSAVSADVTMPANGFYVFTVTNSASSTGVSMFSCMVQARHV